MLSGDSVFGIVTLLISMAFLIMGLNLGAGSLAGGIPGPGFFPVVICSIMAVVSVVLIHRGIREKKHYFKPFHGFRNIPENRRNLLLTIIFSILFLLIWHVSYFLLALIVLLLALNWIYKLKYWINIVYTIVMVLAVYFTFGKLFHVML